MLRLVWKDVVAARLLLLAGLPIYALNLAAMSRVPAIYFLMSLVFSAVLAFGSLVMEEIQGTGTLWASLPVRRADIVFARYLTTVLGASLGLGISLGIDRAAAFLGEGSDGPGSAASALGAHLLLLLLLLAAAALALPLCFRLGAGNGALAFGAVAVGGILALTLASQAVLWLVGLSNPLLDLAAYRGAPEAEQVRAAAAWLRQRGPLLLGLGGLVTAAGLAVSAGLSRRFLEMRDL